MAVVEVNVRGCVVRHCGPGPWRVQGFASGVAAILNDLGINYVSFPANRGKVLMPPDDAEVICAALNERHGRPLS